MKINLLRAVLIFAAAIYVAGCGPYNKIINGEDPDLKYTTALKYMDAGKYRKAAELLGKVVLQYGGTPREDTVQYYLGLANYKRGYFMDSSEQFDDFRKSFPRSGFIEEVEYMYARSCYFMSLPPNRDQSMTQQAIAAINEYLMRYPASVKRESLQENLKELEQKLLDKSFINAKVYYDTENYKSAIIAFNNSLSMFPESNHREEIMYLIVKSSYLLAEHSVLNLQRERYLNTLDAYYNYVGEFPAGKHIKEVNEMRDKTNKFLGVTEKITSEI